LPISPREAFGIARVQFMERWPIVRLSDEERTHLTVLLGKKVLAAQKRKRIQVLLKADASADGPAWIDSRIAEAYDVSVVTVGKLAYYGPEETKLPPGWAMVGALADRDAPPTAEEWRRLKPELRRLPGHADDAKVSMIFQDAVATEVWANMAIQCRMRAFFEPPKLFDEVADKRLTCRFEDVTWEKALSETLEQHGLAYRIEGGPKNRYILVFSFQEEGGEEAVGVAVRLRRCMTGEGGRLLWAYEGDEAVAGRTLFAAGGGDDLPNVITQRGRLFFAHGPDFRDDRVFPHGVTPPSTLPAYK
jgi:hypothetical protein